MTALLIACGTSTLKSLLPQGAYAPHVYPRLRKRLSRCTLDCGFKTSESPALRGFVGGPRALATAAALYLVLKSNGLRYSKNLPVKFGFSPIDTPANIAKKLPLQRCFKPLLIALFNFSHKRPTFAFTSESGYTLGSLRKIVHSGLHAETQGFTHAAVWSVQLSSRIWTEKSRRKRMHALRRVSASFGAAAPLGYSVSYPSTFESVTPLYNVSQIRFRH